MNKADILRRKSDQELNTIIVNSSEYPVETLRAIRTELRRRESLTGIGGWLVLPAILVVVWPMGMFLVIALDLENLSSPNSATIASLYAGYKGWAVGRIVLFGIQAFCNVVVMVCFFRRKPSVPRLVVALLLANVGVSLVDYSWSRVVVGAFAPDPVGLVHLSIQAAIWIPYFLSSRRVRQTFAPKPNMRPQPTSGAHGGVR